MTTLSTPHKSLPGPLARETPVKCRRCCNSQLGKLKKAVAVSWIFLADREKFQDHHVEHEMAEVNTAEKYPVFCLWFFL